VNPLQLKWEFVGRRWNGLVPILPSRPFGPRASGRYHARNMPGNVATSSAASFLARRFVVLDGPEGCGKSTQLRLLADRLALQGIPCLTVRDPGATHLGERIREILLDPAHQEMTMRCEMLLYMAARAQLMSQTILPALDDGRAVLCDRFISSTLAYQLGGQGLTADDIRQVGNIAIFGRWPDLIILLDMPVEQSFARIQRLKDRIEQRSLDYHRQVRRNFLAQVNLFPGKYRVVEAAQPVELVHEQIWQILLSLQT
jgi:dTMP kinase